MSFLKGSFSAQRFTAADPEDAFGERHIASLAAFSINRTQAGDDGVQVGWSGGDHKYDGELSCEKNLRGEFLQWAFRVTKFAPPADEVRAVYLTELKGIMDAAGVQVPTAKMKREARESAQSIIEEKGKDGRYDKHTLVPVVWDGEKGQVWYGSASHGNVGPFIALFEQTFGVPLTPITSGWFLSSQLSEYGDDPEPNPSFAEPAWCPDGFDWLGNEFALNLIYDTATGTDSLFGCMVTNKLILADPNGASGSDMFTVETPAILPEVHKAIQTGKLPRQIGIHLKVNPQEWVPLTIDPELWVVSGCKVPDPEEMPPGIEGEVQRLEQCRDVFLQLDKLFEQFLDIRLGDGWAVVVSEINNWTGRVPAEVK